MTQYFQAPGGHNAAAAQLGVDRVRDALTAGASLFPTSEVFTVTGQVDDIDEATGDLTNSFNVTQRVVAGTSGTAYAPIACGLCVVWVTAEFKRGRRVIGKTFLVPVASSSIQTDGTPGPTSITTAQAFADSMDNPGATAVSLGVWSRPVAGAGGTFHAVVGNRVNDKYSILRSRRD